MNWLVKRSNVLGGAAWLSEMEVRGGHRSYRLLMSGVVVFWVFWIK